MAHEKDQTLHGTAQEKRMKMEALVAFTRQQKGKLVTSCCQPFSIIQVQQN